MDFNDRMEPLKIFNEHFDCFKRVERESSNLNEDLKIESYIISASELNKIRENHSTDLKNILVLAKVFILDQDLILPGINLSIASPEWRVYEQIKIDLRGEDKKSSIGFRIQAIFVVWMDYLKK